MSETTALTVVWICGLIWFAALMHVIKRIILCGTYYILFDMRRYHVYRRGFLHDWLYASANDEIGARRLVTKARAYPPRKIWFV